MRFKNYDCIFRIKKFKNLYRHALWYVKIDIFIPENRSHNIMYSKYILPCIMKNPAISRGKVGELFFAVNVVLVVTCPS